MRVTDGPFGARGRRAAAAAAARLLAAAAEAAAEAAAATAAAAGPAVLPTESLLISTAPSPTDQYGAYSSLLISLLIPY